MGQDSQGFTPFQRQGREEQPGVLTFWMSHVKLFEYLNIGGHRGMGIFLLLSDQISVMSVSRESIN